MATIEATAQPHSIEAEEAVIGSILIYGDVMADVIHILPDERAFHARETRAIYGAMKRLWKTGAPVGDIVLVTDEMIRGGDPVEDSYFTALLNAAPSSMNAEYYAQIVADTYTRRQVLAAAGKIAQAAYNERLPINDVLSMARRETVGIHSVGDNTVQDAEGIADDFLSQFLSDAENGLPEDAIVMTGLLDLDAMTGGYEKGFTHVIMGRPGHMKSGLAIKIALAAARRGQRVLFLSLEMTVEQLVGRMVSQMCGLTYQSIRRANRKSLSPDDLVKVTAAVGEFRRFPIHIDPTPSLTPSQMQARVDRLCAMHDVDVVIIDHMHLARPDRANGNETVELKDIITEITAIAKKYNVAMIPLAQMNRNIEARETKVPQMSDVNGSGAIEAAASTVVGMVWPVKFNPDYIDQKRIELWLIKNRDGKTGLAVAHVNPDLMRIDNAVISDLNRY